MIDAFVIYGKKYVICRNSLVALQEESAVTSFEKLNVWTLYNLYFNSEDIAITLYVYYSLQVLMQESLC